MRSLFLSVVLGLATLGVWGFAPSQAQARWWGGGRGYGYYPAYSSYYYPGYSYYAPAYSSYYSYPAYSSYYSYPAYRSYYYAPPVTYVPSYSTYYTPYYSSYYYYPY